MIGLLLFVLLFGVGTAVTLRWPAAGIGLMLCLWSFQQWLMTQHQLFVKAHALPNVAVAVVLAVGIFVHLMRRQSLLRSIPLTGWIYGALLALSLCSLFWSIYPTGTVDRWVDQAPKVAVYVLLASLVLCSPVDVRVGLISTLVFGGITLPLLLLTDVSGRMVETAALTSLGPAYNVTTPLGVARAAAVIGIVAGLIKLHGLPRPLRLLRWGLVLVAIAVIIRSGSRGEFVFLVMIVGVALPLAYGISNFRQVAAILGGFLVVGVGGFILFDYLTTIADPSAARWESQDIAEALAVRWEMIEIVLYAWADSSPLRWGLGLGAAAAYHPRLLEIYPHNVPVEILTELGLAGFILYGAFCVLTARATVRLLRAAKFDPDLRAIVAIVFALTGFFFLVSLKSGDFLSSYLFFLFAIVMGKLEMWVYRMPAGVSYAHSSTSLVADGRVRAAER